MNRFKQRYRNRVMEKKRKEAKQVKEEFSDSGEADKMIAVIREKRKPSIKVEDLPY